MKSRANFLFLKEIERKLKGGRVPSALQEAEMLLRHFGRMNRMEFLMGDKLLSASTKNLIVNAVRTRLKGFAIQHLLKEADFYGRSFYVTPDVLIPRPETECLVEEALDVLKATPRASRPQILDIGTGSGCIAISLTIEGVECRMTALDVSEKALKIARRNLDRHELGSKIRLLKSDIFSAFGKEKKAFWDVIVSNPPYISSKEISGLPVEVQREPSLALDGGEKGLDIIDRILNEAPYFLKNGGWLLMEIAKGQSKLLAKKLAKNTHYKNIRFKKDLTGIERILIAQKN